MGPAALLAILTATIAPTANCQSSCYCSGVSSDCRVSSSHYWSTRKLPAAVLVHDLAVVDRQGRDLEVNIRYHEDTQEATYTHQPGETSVQYWALPASLAGKKLTSYGGNLTIHHRSVFSGSPVEDSEVIMRGRDGTVLHYGLGAGHRTSDRETIDR